MWFGSSANLRKVPPGVGSLCVVEPVPFVRDIGVMIDFELSMREQHVSPTAQVSFYHLRRLSSHLVFILSRFEERKAGFHAS